MGCINSQAKDPNQPASKELQPRLNGNQQPPQQYPTQEQKNQTNVIP